MLPQMKSPVAFVISVALALLPALPLAEESSDRPLRIVVSSVASSAAVAELRQTWLDRFTAETGLEATFVEHLGATTDVYLEYVATSMESGAIDVAAIDTVHPGILANVLLPLESGNFDEELLAAMMPSVASNYETLDGNHLGASWFTDYGLFYYRSDLLEKYNFSEPSSDGWTYDEMYEIALAVQTGERAEGNTDFDGFVWTGDAYEGLTCVGLEIIAGHNGGTLLDSYGNVTIGNAQAREAVERMVSWVHGDDDKGLEQISPLGVVSYQETDIVERFCNEGNAMFARTWPGVVTNCNSVGMGGRFGVTRNPGVTRRNGRGTLGGWALGVSKYSQYKEQAMRFVELTASYDWQKEHFLIRGVLPTRSDLANDQSLCNGTEPDTCLMALSDLPIDLTSFLGSTGLATEVQVETSSGLCPDAHYATVCEPDVLDYIVPRPSLVSGSVYSDVSTAFSTPLNTILTSGATGELLTKYLQSSECEMMALMNAANMPFYCYQACEAGYYMNKSDDACHACSAGSYSQPIAVANASNAANGTLILHTSQYHHLVGDTVISLLPSDGEAALAGRTFLGKPLTDFSLEIWNFEGEAMALNASSSAAEEITAIRQVFQCTSCSVGSFTAESGLSSCSNCAVGSYTSTIGSTVCIRCDVGYFTSNEASTVCEACPDGRSTAGYGSVGLDECLCKDGSYAWNPSGGNNSDFTCVSCGKGAVCEGLGNEPQSASGYLLTEIKEDGLSILQCFADAQRCPGGPLGTCAAGRHGVACALCEHGLRPGDNGECTECSGSEAWLAAGLLVLAVVFLVVLYWQVGHEDSARRSQSVVVIAATFAQTLSMLQLMGVISRMSLEWPEPMESIIKSLSVFSLDIGVLRVNCFYTFDPLQVYIAKIGFLPSTLAYLILVHVLISWVFFGGRLRERSHALIGSTGLLVMAFFISISSSILSPVQCNQHPNGRWTMREYEQQFCWESGSHTIMVVIAAISLVIPLTFFAGVVRLIFIFPMKMKTGDVRWLNTYTFLFARTKPEQRWFTLFLLVRNLAVAMLASIPNAFWQYFLLQACFSFSCRLTLFFRPYRYAISNALEVFTGTGVLVLLSITAVYVEEADATGVPFLGMLGLISCLALCPIVGIIAAVRHCAPRPKTYRWFLCHQKSATGAFARLLKLALLERGRQSRGGSKAFNVFLDSDDLSDLAKLFGYVQSEVETLIVLCSKEVLLSPWCVGEVTTAHLNSVEIVPLHFNDFERPSNHFIDNIDELVKMERLTENGIGTSEVQDALVHFRDLSHVEVPERVTELSLTTLLIDIVRSTKSGNSSSVISLASMTSMMQDSAHISGLPFNDSGGSLDRPNILLADAANREASAGAFIFLKLITPVLSHMPKQIPVLQEYDPEAPGHGFALLTPESCLILFCTQGCFNSPGFLLGLMHAVSVGVNFVVPIVAADDFQFPTKAFYSALEQTVQSLCFTVGAPTVDGTFLTAFVESIFQKICSRLSLLSNIEVLKVQTQLIWKLVEDRATSRVNGSVLNERQSCAVNHFTAFGLQRVERTLIPRLEQSLRLTGRLTRRTTTKSSLADEPKLVDTDSSFVSRCDSFDVVHDETFGDAKSI